MKTLFDMAKKAVLPCLAIIGVGYAVYYSLYARDTVPAAPAESFAGYATGGKLAGAGIVEPAERTVAVAPPLPGVVEWVIGQDRVGDLIKKGEDLLRLDRQPYEAQLKVRRAQLASAEAELQRMKNAPRKEDLPPLEAKENEARIFVAEKRSLYDTALELAKKKAISQEELRDKMFAYEMAKAQRDLAAAELDKMRKGTWAEDLLVAEAGVMLAKSQVDEVLADLDRLSVRCQSDLTLLSVDVRPQEYVGIPPGKSIILLGDTKNMKVRVYIDEHDASRFRPGAKAVANLPMGRENLEFPLVYVRHEPVVIPKPTLTGEQTERVDVRVLQVVYKFAKEEDQGKVFVGQQLDVYVEQQ